MGLPKQNVWKCSNYLQHHCNKMSFTPQVLDCTAVSSSSVDGLKDVVMKAEALLLKDSLLSGQALGQIFYSVSRKLNDQFDELKKPERKKVTALTDCRLQKFVWTLTWVAKVHFCTTDV